MGWGGGRGKRKGELGGGKFGTTRGG